MKFHIDCRACGETLEIIDAEIYEASYGTVFQIQVSPCQECTGFERDGEHYSQTAPPTDDYIVLEGNCCSMGEVRWSDISQPDPGAAALKRWEKYLGETCLRYRDAGIDTPFLTSHAGPSDLLSWAHAELKRRGYNIKTRDSVLHCDSDPANPTFRIEVYHVDDANLEYEVDRFLALDAYLDMIIETEPKKKVIFIGDKVELKCLCVGQTFIPKTELPNGRAPQKCDVRVVSRAFSAQSGEYKGVGTRNLDVPHITDEQNPEMYRHGETMVRPCVVDEE